MRNTLEGISEEEKIRTIARKINANDPELIDTVEKSIKMYDTVSYSLERTELNIICTIVLGYNLNPGLQ